jgi:hypothetical protein
MAIYDINSALLPYSFAQSAVAGLQTASGIQQLQDLASKRRSTMALARAMRGDAGAMADINDPEMLTQAQQFQRQQGLRGFFNPVDQSVVGINSLETLANAKPRGFDVQGAVDYMVSQGAGADEISPLLKLAEMRTPKADQYGNTLAAAVDEQGNLVYVQPGGPSGARVIQGVRPPEGMTVVNAGNERILVGGKTGREQGRIPVQVDPTAIYTQGAQAQRQERGAQLDVLTEAQKEAIRLQNVGQMAEQKSKGEAKAERDIEVAAKVRSAEDAISELVPLRQALSKLPSPAALKVESAKAFFGMENPRIQAALGDVQRISGRMLEYVNRLPGAATDADREIFMASAGVLADPNTPASRKIAAADSAIQSYQRLIQKYGKGQSQPQRQQVNILPPASQLPGKIATDNTTGIRYKSDGTKWVRIP